VGHDAGRSTGKGVVLPCHRTPTITMTPEQFIRTWKSNSLSERGGAQPHFEDLCRLLGVDPPRQEGHYCYEQGIEKLTGGRGYADVWKRGCFAWENKGPEKDLRPALMQLRNYASALENPPVLAVCNRDAIQLHPNFTGYPSPVREIRLEDIGRPENLQALRWLFSETDVLKLRPGKSNAAITAEAAGEFARLAKTMRDRSKDLPLEAQRQDSQRIAHFLIQCIFCMYAEDEGLLHEGEIDDPAIFTGILRQKRARSEVEFVRERLSKLFKAMQKKGGEYGNDSIAWFNGGLFNRIDVPALTLDDVEVLRRAAESMDWRAIDPTIFGTLFERGLDPDSRAPLGAHYTDVGTIGKLIHPLITEPLQAEWAQARAVLAAGQGKGPHSEARKAGVAAYQAHLDRLRNFRVLDPACGSGNFLYMAMRALKDLEHRAHIEAEALGYGAGLFIQTGPANILGIEKNEYAAELARVTVWIGDLQWSLQNGKAIATDPILRSLDTIECRDAILNEADGSEPDWPTADVIVGNPPFLGDKMMLGDLGEPYVKALRKRWAGRVPGGADLVTYWFEKARAQIEAGRLQAAGLVSTNSIRGGANRKVLDRIVETTRIFEAWSDESWVNEGAAVRVSLVAFGDLGADVRPSRLNGQQVSSVHADLTAGEGLDLTTAVALAENRGASFIGGMKKGSFDVPGSFARDWLKSGGNPNGRPNSDVLKPWVNGLDITRRPMDAWIIDFGLDMPLNAASLYETPIAHVISEVKPARASVANTLERERWWLHARPAPDLRHATAGMHRFIGTARVAKHRLFVWLRPPVVCDGQVVVIAAPTTPPSASSIPASTNCGRCGCVPTSGWATTHATHRPPPSRTSPSRPA
jgi:hypothetical protein